MGTKINIMGLEVDLISTDTLVSKIQEYLGNDCLNIILFATTDLLEETNKDKELKQLVLESDLILPGDETLLSLHHVDTLKIASMVISYNYLSLAFDSIRSEEKSMYIVAQNEKDVKLYTDIVKDKYYNIHVVGSFYHDLEQNEELVINEINSLTPDILLFLIDTPLQERFVMQNRLKLNSKLCVGLGSVNLNVVKTQKQPPKLFRNKTLEPLYFFFVENKGIKKIRDTRIFKRKVEHYKNKKGGKMNGDN